MRMEESWENLDLNVHSPLAQNWFAMTFCKCLTNPVTSLSVSSLLTAMSTLVIKIPGASN